MQQCWLPSRRSIMGIKSLTQIHVLIFVCIFLFKTTHYQQKEDGDGPYKELVSRNELSHISAEVVICCVWNRPKKMYTCTATFHTCFLAILLIPVVHLLMGSSLVIEDEGLYQPDSRTRLVMIFRAIDISIILQFYKHNSLPFGPIQALIAFY